VNDFIPSIFLVRINKGMAIFMTIFFTFCEWSNVLKDVTGSKRKKLKKSFENVLTKKLQDEGVKCWLEQK
jgi:hypothetical protein